MKVTINGKQTEVADGSSIPDLIAILDYPERGVAVAVDGEVVPSRRWHGVALRDGSRVEILRAVQGG